MPTEKLWSQFNRLREQASRGNKTMALPEDPWGRKTDGDESERCAESSSVIGAARQLRKPS